MSMPINAFDHEPSDFIRDVSLEALGFYVTELEGLYIPEGSEAEHKDSIDLRRWEPSKRTAGKFGRFVLGVFNENGEMAEIEEDILVMGTTIPLGEPSGRGSMSELLHVMLEAFVYRRLSAEGCFAEGRSYAAVDYGATRITVTGEGVEGIRVGASSFNLGRADEQGRSRTIELFNERLDGLDVDNTDPVPRQQKRIISPQGV